MKKIDLNIEKFNLNFEEKGKYIFSIIGGFYIKSSENFKVVIKKSKQDKSIHTREIVFKKRFIFENRRAVEYLQFYIDSIGEYEITIRNINDLKLNKSMLFLQRLLFNDIVSTNEIEGLISKV